MVDLQKESKAWESMEPYCWLERSRKKNKQESVQHLNWRERNHMRVVEVTCLETDRSCWMEREESSLGERRVEIVEKKDLHYMRQGC